MDEQRKKSLDEIHVKLRKMFEENVMRRLNRLTEKRRASFQTKKDKIS